MTRTPRHPLARLAAAGAGVLLASSLAACGGDDEAASPDAASSSAPSEDGGSEGESSEGGDLSPAVEEFCGAYASVFDELSAVDPDASKQEQATAGIKALKSWGETLGSADVPDEMPDDAAEGLDVIVSTIADLDEDATLADLSGLDGSFSGPEREASEAFTAWTTEQCPLDLAGGLPSAP